MKDIPDWFKANVKVIVVDDTCHHSIPLGIVLTLGRKGYNPDYPDEMYHDYNNTYVTYRDVVPIAPKTLEELL